MIWSKLLAKLGRKNELTAKKFDPDERWSNLYREREKNSIYKWVGTRSGESKLVFPSTQTFLILVTQKFAFYTSHNKIFFILYKSAIEKKLYSIPNSGQSLK